MEFLNFRSTLGLLQRKAQAPEPPALTARFPCFTIASVQENQEFLCGTKDVPGNETLGRDWKKKEKNVEFSSDSEVPEWGSGQGLET